MQYLLTVLPYVLRNPVRAQLVESVTQWPWSSLQHPTLADPLPFLLPADWLYWVEQPLFDDERTTLRTSLNRQWLAESTGVADLDSTLRPCCWPRKILDKYPVTLCFP